MASRKRRHSVTAIFVDTVAWIALLNSRDELHVSAVDVRKQLYQARTPLITSQFVLLEGADALSAPGFRTRTVTFLSGLREETGIEIIPVSSELFDAGLSFFAQCPDKEWSLTDCISFATMTER